MTEDIRSTGSEQRIANAQAYRRKVDSQGRPIDASAVFHYDERGRLVEVTPPPNEEN